MEYLTYRTLGKYNGRISKHRTEKAANKRAEVLAKNGGEILVLKVIGKTIPTIKQTP